MLAQFTPGLRFMALSAFWFSLGNVCIRLAGETLPFMEVVLGRSLIGVSLCLWLLRKEGLGDTFGHDRQKLFWRGVFGAAAMILSFYAVVKLPLAVAVVVFYTSPVFTALFSRRLLGEQVGARVWGCVGLSLVGVLLVARPDKLLAAGASMDLLAVGAALLGAVCASLAYTLVRRLGATEHPLTIVLYLCLVTLPISTGLSLPGWVWPDGRELAILTGLGVATQLAQYCMTRAFHLEKAGKAGSVGYLQVVFAALWGLLFFGESLPPDKLAGMALIVAATLLVAGKKHPDTTPPDLRAS